MRYLPWACLALVLWTAALAQAPETNGAIRGFVRLESGAGLAGAVVTVTAGGKTFTITTDNGGMFFLRVPAGDVTITSAGTGTTVIVPAGDQPVGEPLILTVKMRPQVKQRIFNAQGKPAPFEVVTISYAWDRKLVLDSATANDAGVVTWKNLPPVRAIVWGRAVPAGVLPAGVTEVAERLPAPVPEGRPYGLILNAPALNPPPSKYYIATEGTGSGVPGHFMPLQPSAPRIPLNSYQQVLGGSRVSAVLAALEPTCCFAVLDGMYAPYAPEGSMLSLPLVWQNGLTLPLKLTVNGAPVPGLSRFRVEPVKVSSLPDFALHATGLTEPFSWHADEPGGARSLRLPGPGTYRLAVDLFDGTVPSPPELLLTVRAGQTEAAVALPPPLLTAPGATEISYLLTTGPHTRRQFTLNPDLKQAPLFGPKDGLLALWYRSTPTTLALYTPWDARTTLRTLTQRTVTISLEKLPTDTPTGSALSLLPLLPDTVTGMVRTPTNDPAPPRPETAVFNLRRDDDKPLILWSGRYLVERSTPAGWAVLDIPATGPAQIAIPAEFTPLKRGLPGQQGIHFQLPQADYQEKLEGIAGTFLLLFDVPAFMPASLPPSMVQNRVLNYIAPAGATRVTLVWAGRGVASNLEIPTAGAPTINVAQWEDGATVSGVMLQTDGKPAVRLPCSIVMPDRGNFELVRFTTSGNGTFSVPHLPAGQLGLIVNPGMEWSGWMLDVPAQGMRNLELRLPDKRRRVIGVGVYAPMDMQQAWWAPDDGPAVRLPAIRGEICPNEPLSGPGSLWLIDMYGGSASVARFTDGPVQAVYFPMAAAARAPLGLYMPLDLAAGLPGAVTIRGHNERAWLQVDIAMPRWQTSTALGLCTAQVDALPTGEYTVTIATSRGPVSADVVITPTGGTVWVRFPPAKP